MTVVSCHDDYLEVIPKGSMETLVVFSDESSTEAALVSCYDFFGFDPFWTSILEHLGTILGL